MGDNIDLNIENYDLSDLLNLFKLDYNFGENELKRSKKQVMLTHPDISICRRYFHNGTLTKRRNG